MTTMGSTVIILKIHTNDNNAYGRLFHFVFIYCIFHVFFLLIYFTLSSDSIEDYDENLKL